MSRDRGRGHTADHQHQACENSNGSDHRDSVPQSIRGCDRNHFSVWYCRLRSFDGVPSAAHHSHCGPRGNIRPTAHPGTGTRRWGDRSVMGDVNRPLIQLPTPPARLHYLGERSCGSSPTGGAGDQERITPHHADGPYYSRTFSQVRRTFKRSLAHLRRHVASTRIERCRRAGKAIGVGKPKFQAPPHFHHSRWSGAADLALRAAPLVTHNPTAHAFGVAAGCRLFQEVSI